MSAPPGYAQRPATWGDLDDVVSLFRACDVADAGVEDPVRAHVEDDWRRADRGLDHHTRLVHDREEALAGYASALALNPAISVEAFVRVHPSHRGRGIGAHLLTWAEGRGRELVPPGAEPVLRALAPANDEAAARLLASKGYGRVRVFWQMERALSAGVAPVPDPEGVAIRSYRHEVDADPFYDAIEEAFADHWGYEPYPRDLHRREIEGMDPALMLVALDGDRIAGASMSRVMEGVGWVDLLAVRRPWRGRGIARALLARSFGALAARGCAAAMLSVDSANETGATRLYRSAGMTVRRAWHLYERPLDVS